MTDVLESLDQFERRIQEISKTLQRCDGQIDFLDQRLQNFSVTDQDEDLHDKTVTVTKVADRFNHFVEKLKKLLNAHKKLLSLMKQVSVSAAKTAYMAAIPAAVTTAVVAPQLTGKFLTVVEKAKIVALSGGNYANKLAAFEQLASTGSLDASTCNENASACEAIQELEFNTEQLNNLENRTTLNEFNKAGKTSVTANSHSTAETKAATAGAKAATAGAKAGASIASGKGAEAGKAATEAKISIAGKIVPATGAKGASATGAKAANASAKGGTSTASKATTALTAKGETAGKAATEAKISIEGKEVLVDGAKEPTGIAAMIQANPSGSASGNAGTGGNNGNNAGDNSSENVSTITQTPENSTPTTSPTTTPTSSKSSVTSSDPSNTVIIDNKETDNATVIQNGMNNFVRITQPGGQTVNVTQAGSLNTATVNQNK